MSAGRKLTNCANWAIIPHALKAAIRKCLPRSEPSAAIDKHAWLTDWQRAETIQGNRIMREQTVDAQCRSILDGLISLEDLFEGSLAKEALELETNAESARNRDMLRRLRLSLEHYTERGKDLLYVGLMGNFSSGKSSTINSLLALDEHSRDARATGLNPTDKSITLVTHSENDMSIFKNTREGLLAIRASYVDA